MKSIVQVNRIIGKRDPMIYGHFLEHFHRQVYEGVFEPGSPLSDEQGMRADVIKAMKRIKVPVIRWPGGCFVSSYHWKEGVGKERIPSFDKAWRVEEPNTFGTDEFIDLCRKVDCEPYICTNAGTGSVDEMSDWVEYCNLESKGRYAAQRIENGHKEPYHVKYWSIGNENWGGHELGAKTSQEWGHLVCEAGKLMLRADPTVQLSAAALQDINWNVNLLKQAGRLLRWISIHGYWDNNHDVGYYAPYEQAMIYTECISPFVDRVRGTLTALDLQNEIRIAFDEWNLRGWIHPNIHGRFPAVDEAEYLVPRDDNDDNSEYTMADAIFTACFLNSMNRNCDIVGMANFAPIVNTRGCIYAHKEGIVLRSTYYVFDLYVNLLGETVLDCWNEGDCILTVTDETGQAKTLEALDIIATRRELDGAVVFAAVNKDAYAGRSFIPQFIGSEAPARYRLHTLNGDSIYSYNDIGRDEIGLTESAWLHYQSGDEIILKPHSVNIIEFSV